MPFSRADAEVEAPVAAVTDRRYNRSERAFTLIELLVVIVIIAVLMGLAFPVYQSIQNQAKKTQAKNDVTQIVTAVNAFYTEYGKYPLPASATDDAYSVGAGGGNSKDVFAGLRGLDPGLNPRQIVFISPAEDKTQVRSKGKVGSDGQFYDPWGTAYALRIDSDYNNTIPNPYSGTGGAGADPIRQGVIAWSLGKDQSPGKGGNNIFSSSDDVISWQ
jgi:prepilin-type N-terminal cleavage/methylation domain-containing protein